MYHSEIVSCKDTIFIFMEPNTIRQLGKDKRIQIGGIDHA